MKFFKILALGIFLSGCAALEMPVQSGMSKDAYCSAKNLGAISAICNNKYFYFKDGNEVLKKGNTYAVFKNVTQPTTSTFTSNNFGNGTFVAEARSWEEAQRIMGISSSNTSSNDQSISFNIKEKKNQCEAIGFKPETEKYADCVLRLVELDVQQQQQDKIAMAQNAGNDALVQQLQRQNNLQSSQALINLGQELLKPQQYNSNIYMPQTQRCTIQGFGSFANMICR